MTVVARRVCHHSHVLNESVIEQELRTDDANLWAHETSGHLLEPRRLDNLGVVVEQHDELARAVSHAKVDKSRVVEPLALARLPANHPHAFAPRDQLVVKRKRICVRTAVLYQHDLVTLVGRPLQNAFYAGAQQVRMITRRDDDAHKRLGFRQLVAHAVGIHKRSILNRRGNSPAIQVGLKGALSGFVRIRLLVSPTRGRPLMLAPVIEHARHMHHLARHLKRFECEVVVLRTRHVIACPIRMLKHISTHHEEVRYVVVGIELSVVREGLEGGSVHMSVTHMILVAVQQIDTRILQNRLDVAP